MLVCYGACWIPLYFDIKLKLIILEYKVLCAHQLNNNIIIILSVCMYKCMYKCMYVRLASRVFAIEEEKIEQTMDKFI